MEGTASLWEFSWSKMVNGKPMKKSDGEKAGRVLSLLSINRHYGR
jgi:hypothetical protein